MLFWSLDVLRHKNWYILYVLFKSKWLNLILFNFKHFLMSSVKLYLKNTKAKKYVTQDDVEKRRKERDRARKLSAETNKRRKFVFIYS